MLESPRRRQKEDEDATRWVEDTILELPSVSLPSISLSIYIYVPEPSVCFFPPFVLQLRTLHKLFTRSLDILIELTYCMSFF